MRLFFRCCIPLMLIAFSVTPSSASGQPGTFGTMPDGRPIHTYVMRNRHGLTAKVMDLGATILEINVPDRAGQLANVVLELKDPGEYATVGPVNAIVGRYANRIAHGFDLDGEHFPLVQNARGITLHGGTDPYSNRLWSLQSASSDAVTFTLASPDGDQGFPGALMISVTYRLTAQNEFSIEYTASVTSDTYLNLTNHIYFNLHPCPGCTILNQQLKVFADRYTPTNELGVPLGTELPVAGTALDFHQLTPVGARLDPRPDPAMQTVRGYDHNFVLNGTSGTLHDAADLVDPVSGRVLMVQTTEPGIQVFSGGRPHPEIALMTGGSFVQSAALALETQHFPDSPNHQNFPSTLLRPGETFRSRTVFRFSTERAER